MDLGAYAQIEDLDLIAKENGIDVPRLRGYRLMRDEKPVDLKEVINRDETATDCVKELCEGRPFWSTHPEKRKVLKTHVHNETKRKTKQWETFNKYAGRDDILYIHARIGGGNWPDYYEQVIYQPWFIEKVDDSFDSTYCDIYARIKPIKEID